jgi:hypothetical protein
MCRTACTEPQCLYKDALKKVSTLDALPLRQSVQEGNDKQSNYVDVWLVIGGFIFKDPCFSHE